MWAAFVGFLQSIITGINSLTGNFGVSVILFTILTRLALLPLDWKAKSQTKKMGDLNPEIQKINEKYKNDAEKKNKKTMELYQQHKVNPMGGCLPMLLQLPVMFAMFAALRAIASIELQNFYIDLIKSSDTTIGPILQDFVLKVQDSAVIKQNLGDVFTSLFGKPNVRLIEQLTEVVGQTDMNTILDTIKNIGTQQAMDFLKAGEYASYKFLWIKNVWVADSPLKDIIGRSIPFMGEGWNGIFILSGLAGITSYYQMKLTTPPGDNQQTKGMAAMMPLMSVWFTSMYTSSFSIYWVTSNIFQIGQQLIYNRMNPKDGSAKGVAKSGKS